MGWVDGSGDGLNVGWAVGEGEGAIVLRMRLINLIETRSKRMNEKRKVRLMKDFKNIHYRIGYTYIYNIYTHICINKI